MFPKSGFYVVVESVDRDTGFSKSWELGPYDEKLLFNALSDISKVAGNDDLEATNVLMSKVCAWYRNYAIDYFAIRYYDQDGIGYVCNLI